MAEKQITRRQFLNFTGGAAAALALPNSPYLLSSPEQSSITSPWQVMLTGLEKKAKAVFAKGARVVRQQGTSVFVQDPLNQSAGIIELTKKLNFAVAVAPESEGDRAYLMLGEWSGVPGDNRDHYNLLYAPENRLGFFAKCGMDGWRTSLNILQGVGQDGQFYTGQASVRQIYDADGQIVPELFYSYIGKFNDLAIPSQQLQSTGEQTSVAKKSKLDVSTDMVNSFNSKGALVGALSNHLRPTTQHMLSSDSQDSLNPNQIKKVAEDLVIYYPQMTIKSQLDLLSTAFTQVKAQAAKQNHTSLSPTQLAENIVQSFSDHGVELPDAEKKQIMNGPLTDDLKTELAWRFATEVTDLNSPANYGDVPISLLGSVKVKNGEKPEDGNLQVIASGEDIHLLTRSLDPLDDKMKPLYMHGKYVQDQWGGSFVFDTFPTYASYDLSMDVGTFSMEADKTNPRFVHIAYDVKSASNPELWYTRIDGPLLATTYSSSAFLDKIVPYFAKINKANLAISQMKGYPIVSVAEGKRILTYGPSIWGGFDQVPVVTNYPDVITQLDINVAGEVFTHTVCTQNGNTSKMVHNTANGPRIPFSSWLPLID